jgi:cytochrome c-type biogenesis protein CcmH
MRVVLACLLWLAMLPASVSAWAQANQQADAAPLQFQDAREEARFHALAAELRCVMCQNQSLADSNALIALELRREVLDLIRAGRTDAQVKDHLVQRYGEFVLYKPKMQGRTWLLWLGPAVILLAGAVLVVALVRRKPAQAIPRNDEPQEW